MKLNKQEEAEKALLNSKHMPSRSFMKENKERQIPQGAAGYYLLGIIHHKKEKEKDACL